MPQALMTIRLDSALRTRLRAAARRRSVTPSAAARLAIEAWLAAEQAQAAARPFEQLADLIGIVEGPASGDAPQARPKRKRKRRQSRGRGAR